MFSNSKKEQSELTCFVPDKKIFVGVGVTNYDGVGHKFDQKDRQGNVTKPAGAQAFHDIPNAGSDCEDMKNYLQKYDFDFWERERTKDRKKKTYPYAAKFDLKKHGHQTLWMLNDNCNRKMFDSEITMGL